MNLDYILKATKDREEVIITRIKPGIKKITIPDTIKGVPVVSLGQSCFKDSDLETIIFKTKQLEYIGYGAFWNSKIKKLNLPEGVKHIDDFAFSNCNNLISLVLPTSIQKIGNGITNYCNNLQKITINDPKLFCDLGITQQGYYTENNCLMFKWSSIAANYYEVVAGCKKSNIQANATKINAHAFTGTEIVSVNIPKNVAIIDEYAFADCTQLKRITFTNDSNLRAIKYCAFKGNSIENIKLPKNLEAIYSSAFADCKYLTKVEYNKKQPFALYSQWNTPSYGCAIDPIAFDNCSSLESISIPLGIEALNLDAFRDCKRLTTIKTERKFRIDHSKCRNKGVQLPKNLKTLILCGEKTKFTSPKKLMEAITTKLNV